MPKTSKSLKPIRGKSLLLHCTPLYTLKISTILRNWSTVGLHSLDSQLRKLDRKRLLSINSGLSTQSQYILFCSPQISHIKQSGDKMQSFHLRLPTLAWTILESALQPKMENPHVPPNTNCSPKLPRNWTVNKQVRYWLSFSHRRAPLSWVSRCDASLIWINKEGLVSLSNKKRSHRATLPLSPPTFGRLLVSCLNTHLKTKVCTNHFLYICSSKKANEDMLSTYCRQKIQGRKSYQCPQKILGTCKT